MKKNKFCFISLSAYSLFNQRCSAPFGGSEVQLFLLAKELAKKDDFKVSFVVGDFGQKEQERYWGINVYKFRHRFRYAIKLINGFTFIVRLLKLLRRINADVYLSRAAGVEVGIVSFFCQLFGKKYIYMTASLIDVDHGFKKLNPLAGIFYEWGLKRANSVLTQNNSHQRLLKKNFQKSSQVFKNVMPAVSMKRKKRDIILWVSSCQPLKQPQLFLKLAERFPQQKFVMIMPKHSQSFFDKIRRKAFKINNLKLIKKVPFEKIDHYFEQAKVVACTSLFEGFPNTFVQAARSKTPMLSLKVNPDNFLNRYQCGFCAEGSFEKLVSQLRRLLKDKKLWQKMSQNAYDYFQANHNLKRNIIEFKQLIR